MNGSSSSRIFSSGAIVRLSLPKFIFNHILAYPNVFANKKSVIKIVVY